MMSNGATGRLAARRSVTRYKGIPRGILLLVLCGFTLPGLAGKSAAAPPSVRKQISDEHQAAQARLAARLLALADACEARGLLEPAARMRQLAVPFDQQTLDVDALPSEKQAPLNPALPRDELEWRAGLRKAQTDYATELFKLSQRALREGQLSYAYHLVREVAFHDTDHLTARRLLGYVQYEDRWTTPFEALMLRQGNVWHDRFGWLPRTHVERYEQGERLFRGKWVSSEREAALRADFENAWEVESEHFVIRTNYSLERAVELSVALEDLDRFVRREFADFFTTPQQMQQLFSSGKPLSSTGAGKHLVWYFRTREEFVQFLRNKQPGAEGINGIYMPSHRRAYFFANPDDPDANLQTMYHEVTHQLLSESARTNFDIAANAHFWIVEGIACYMESFDRTDGRLTVGNPRHTRLWWARERITADQWYMPFKEFAALGMQEFQFGCDYPTLQKRYSQATGLTHFFLHYQDGLYRDEFIQHLAQIYSPDRRVRLNVKPLDELLGVGSTVLDEQYKAYIQSLPADPPG